MLLAQISDTHITPAGVETAYSGDPGAGLAGCVDAIVRMRPAPDAVILSGDLVNEGTTQEYARLRALLEPLAMPVYVLPGNHDRRLEMRAAFSDHAYLPRSGRMDYVVEGHAVRLVMLDTVVEGEEGGALDDTQLGWLAAALAARPGEPTAIFMHHPPVATGIRRMDEIALDARSSAALGALVRRHGAIERIACGHVHRAALARWEGTVVSICPSAAFQALVDLGAPGRFTATAEAPGYQMHFWNGGQLVTHTIGLAHRDDGKGGA